jgi:hypothetical protein
MTQRDYAVRTSQMYDDRDGDTVTTLATPIIKTCDDKTPKVVFFLVVDKKTDDKSKPVINVNLEAYARMMDIPEPLRQQVREALGLRRSFS